MRPPRWPPGRSRPATETNHGGTVMTERNDFDQYGRPRPRGSYNDDRMLSFSDYPPDYDPHYNERHRSEGGMRGAVHRAGEALDRAGEKLGQFFGKGPKGWRR